MILVDTSIWIHFFRAQEPYFSALNTLIDERNVVTLECIFGELLQGARSEKEIDSLLEYWKYLPKIEEDNLWIDAGVLSSEKKLFSKGIGLIDAVLLCASQHTNARLWTLDIKLLKACSKDLQYSLELVS